MQQCIDNCLACARTCLEAASHHCLEAGGKHTEPGHFRLMLACAEICRAAAAVMMIGTELHGRVCAACADICEACAEDCQRVGGMDECVAACRRCASSCREMSQS
jgi:hypothetical protein